MTGLPAFFIHPCNTATALSRVVEEGKVPNVIEYLMLWLGIVGGCVGLSVPLVQP